MRPGILEISSVSKSYGALRPLRIERLTIAQGDHVALLGLDQPGAEVFINLVTGATLPDAGDVQLFGRSTAAITDSTDWLQTLDRFGIVSDRAALLESLTVIQNLAVPFSLEIEPPPVEFQRQAAALAKEVGILEPSLDRPVAELDGAGHIRVRLARALAFDPVLLLLEHPTQAVATADVPRLGRHIQSVAARRGLATLAITADRKFAAAVATRQLMLEPSTGRLRNA